VTGRAALPRGPAGPWFLVAGLAIVATGRALGNGFAFDDVPIVFENAQVHQLAPPWEYAQQSYWPPKNLGDAYRPWTVWWLALQWALGGGAPVVFHAFSLVLTVVVALLVYRLLARLVSPAGAVAGAALFAVHPVHVEATANVVGQGELWMTLFVVAAALWYLDLRERSTLQAKHRLGIAGLLVLAAGSKEQGVVLPALLALLESCRPNAGPARDRARALLPFYGLLATVLVGFVAWRYWVLGDLGGGPPAAGLDGLGAAARARVMLPLVPDLARLLVWPRTLLAQYSPPAHGAPVGFGSAELLGVALIVALLGAVALFRASPVSAGLLWVLIALAPVANLLFPTGVLIAERTLFLPSVGIAIVAGALVDAGIRRRWVVGTVAAVIGLCLAGAARSWSRQVVWRDNPTLFAQTVVDEPRSYRAHFVLAKELSRRGNPEPAAEAFREAARLYRGDRRVFEEWGQLDRAAGRCDLAIAIFQDGLRDHPRATVLRSRLFECLLTMDRIDEAIATARAGLDLGMTEFTEPLARATRRRSDRPAQPGPTPGGR